MDLPQGRRETLARAAASSTPCYVYFLDEVLERFERVRAAFGGRFGISFAVKSNPNLALLERLRPHVVTLDVSSGGELDRALRAGFAPRDITFSGPAKREPEVEQAVREGCGEMVCESAFELETLDRLAAAAGRRMRVFLRINPRRVPKGFGVSMAERASQFGIDEEDADAVIERLPSWSHLEFRGFHIYSGTNCLDATAIAENFEIFIEIFVRLSEKHGLRPGKLIFGSGFGIPYHDGDAPLALAQLADLVNPQIDDLSAHPALGGAECVLEMGRYLIGPAGYFLTRIVGEKRSRGVDIRLCDGGFNDHLAACGLMGMVMRRAYPMGKVTGSGNEAPSDYMIVGPLCTAIDILAQKVTLPELRRGDVLAIGASGAYGLSSSPTRFISHPEPREYLACGDEVLDITER